MNSFDHPDNRGVFIEMWTVDILDGDLSAALLFSQLLWWHQTAKDGRPRLAFERDGHRWLVRPDDGWEGDCRMTTKQVRRVRSALVVRGLVEVKRFKVDGAPTSAWRPLYEAIQAATTPIRPNPELPSEGQFHGSDPQGALGSDPCGVVPIPYSTTVKKQTNYPPGLDIALLFERFWSVYPRNEEKGSARAVWPAACKKTDPATIIAAAARYKADPNREDQFTPYPAKWLKNERWTDAPLPQRRSNPAHRANFQAAPAGANGTMTDDEWDAYVDAEEKADR